MNITDVVFRTKLKLGLMNIATPFEDINATIVDIIKRITVPVFSVYQPVKESLTINVNDLEIIEKGTDYRKILLPEFKTRKLIYLFDVRYDTSVLSGLGYYGGGMPYMSGNLMSQLMLANAGAQLMNTMIPKMTFKFEPPRVVWIYNSYVASKIILDFGFQHDDTLASIPETAREEFMKLVLLDVKENLYPTLKMYTELNTSIGNINLKLDDWANAEQDRKELLDKWDDVYHLDMKPIYYI